MNHRDTLKQGEMLCSTTIRIEAENSQNLMGTGTGFFYSMADEGNDYIPVIITNKHVVRGMENIKLVVTQSDVKGNRIDKHFKFQIDNFMDGVIFHPDDSVDLCAITLVPIIEEIHKEGKEMYSYFINKAIIPSKERLEELDAIEEIFMVGYPNGLWDETNNLPLVRKGITASHPKLNYNGKQEFLIDASCFPGSSGSPVFYLDKSYKTQIANGALGHKAYLLGILYSGPTTQIEGRIDVDSSIKVHSTSMINLGFVLKAQRLHELEMEVLKVIPKISK